MTDPVDKLDEPLLLVSCPFELELCFCLVPPLLVASSFALLPVPVFGPVPDPPAPRVLDEATVGMALGRGLGNTREGRLALDGELVDAPTDGA